MQDIAKLYNIYQSRAMVVIEVFSRDKGMIYGIVSIETFITTHPLSPKTNRDKLISIPVYINLWYARVPQVIPGILFLKSKHLQ